MAGWGAKRRGRLEVVDVGEEGWVILSGSVSVKSYIYQLVTEVAVCIYLSNLLDFGVYNQGVSDTGVPRGRRGG